jgi:hypothetical protein
MLNSYELENFKAFGERVRIEFAPITLIFGENSAGKSSILQSLNLLKQTRESREHGSLLLPRAEGGIVDLGSFQELLYDHDTSRTLKFQFEIRPGRRGRRSEAVNGDEDHSYAFEIGFRRTPDDNEVILAFLNLYFVYDDRKELVCRYEPHDLEPEERRDIRPMPFGWRTRRPARGTKIRAAKCVEVTAKDFFWSAMYDSWRLQSEFVLAAIRALRKDVFEGRNSLQLSLFQNDKDAEEAFADAERFYASTFTFEDFRERARTAALGNLLVLDGFIPSRARSTKSTQFPEFDAVDNYSRGGGANRDLQYVDTATLLCDAGRILEDELESLFPMGPYRRAPERLYIFTGTTPQDVGYSGDLLPDLLFRRPELVQETNSWLDRLDIGYNIDIKPVGTRSNDLFEVRLVDTRRKSPIDVALTDVGFGISQLLPFVVQSLSSESRTISIEQPEVHVHPRLQSDLADLMISAVQEPRCNRFLVETHSEHLILRLLRRIRETTDGELPDGHPGLRPEDVSVMYLSRGAGGTEAHRIRIDETGEFIDQWPKGFFEERAKELF